MRLSESDNDVVHGAGVNHNSRNALSHLPTTGKDQTVLDDDLPILAVEAQNGSILDCIKREASGDYYIPNEATQHRSKHAPLNESETIAEQTTDSYCRVFTVDIGTPQLEIHTDSHGIPVQKSSLEEFILIVVLALVRRRTLYLCRNPPIAGHPSQWKMNDTLPHDCFGQHMACDFRYVVAQCVRCAQTGSKCRQNRSVQLLLASSPLVFIVTDNLDPLPYMQKGNQFIVIMTDHYLKQTRAVL